MKKIIGWIRLWVFGFCPECNSDAPELYDCPICRWEIICKENQREVWNRFTEALNKIT